MASLMGAPLVAAVMRLREIGAVDQHHVGAERGELVGQPLAAHDVDGPEALRLGELDQAVADAGIGGVLQDPVAGRERHVFGHHQIGGRRVDLEHGELQRVDAGRHLDDPVGLGELALHPVVAVERDHQVAGRADRATALPTAATRAMHSAPTRAGSAGRIA